jgi:hypothetical protein
MSSDGNRIRASRLSLVLLVATALAQACADLGRGDPLADGAAEPSDAGSGDGGDDAGAVRSFVRDVHRLLLDGCARCHSPDGQASDSALVLVDDPVMDHAATIKFVNAENPAGSRLLVKGAGMGHGGGSIFAVGTPEHRTILEWISQGSAP